jgi:hypothetical protein
VNVHFIHVRSPHEDALPLIMTHGWPGSVIELLETIGPLTDPTAHEFGSCGARRAVSDAGERRPALAARRRSKGLVISSSGC